MSCLCDKLESLLCFVNVRNKTACRLQRHNRNTAFNINLHDRDLDSDASVRIKFWYQWPPSSLRRQSQSIIWGSERIRKARNVAIGDNYVQEHMENGSNKMVHISTDEVIADVLTKPLARFKFKFMCDPLGILPLPSYDTRGKLIFAQVIRRFLLWKIMPHARRLNNKRKNTWLGK